MAQDAEITQGDDVTLQFTIYQDVAETTAQNITGYTGSYRVGKNDSDTTALEVTSINIVNGPAGRCDVALTAAQTTALAVAGRRSVYDHQLQLTDASSNDSTVTRGELTVHERLPAP